MIEDPKKLDRILEKCLRGVDEKGWTIQDCLNRYPELQGEFEPVLRAALRLRESQDLRPSAQFRAKSPHKLKARIQISQRPSTIQRKIDPSEDSSQSRSGPRLLLQWATPLMAAALTTTVALAALGFAADSSRPGDLLYEIDRAMENIQLQFASRSDILARLRLDFASERLDEAIELVERGHPESVDATLEEYQAQIDAAGPLLNEAKESGEASDELVLSTNETLNTQEEQLEELLVIAPSTSQEEIEVAIEEIEILLVIIGSPGDEDDILLFGTPATATSTLTPTPSPTATLTPTPTPTVTPTLTEFDDELPDFIRTPIFRTTRIFSTETEDELSVPE